MPDKLSVVIATYNNESKIKTTLESVKWAEEIIIVDGQSSDRTQDICRQYTNKLYCQPNHPQWNINKNYGFRQAVGGWILNLDSDEIVTSGLRKEIEEILRKGSECDYFYIPRREYFFGKWIKSIWGAEPTYIKLFKKGAAGYECADLHEQMIAKGKAGTLMGHIIHIAYITIKELIERIDAFTTQEAICMKNESFKLKWWYFITRPGRYILYAYIKQGGYKNGPKEFVAIMLWCGYYQFILLVKLRDLAKRQK